MVENDEDQVIKTLFSNFLSETIKNLLRNNDEISFHQV